MQALEEFAISLIKYLAVEGAFLETTSSTSGLGVVAVDGGAEILSTIWNLQLKMCSRARRRKLK